MLTRRLRTPAGEPGRFWTGCHAGLSVVGIRAEGTVVGCLSLPAACDEGNLRERPLVAIWNDETAFAYNRAFDPDRLAGPCAGCAFGRVCRAGCRSLAHASSDHPFANPYCFSALARAD